MKKLLFCFVAPFICSSSIAQIYTISENSFSQATHLVDINLESTLNRRAKSLRDGGFETSAGEQINFYSWYAPRVNEIHITWMTQLTRNFGVIWGIGTGERADKYTIDPSAKLGFVYQAELRKNQLLSVSFIGSVAGDFREHTCMADYGDIGGIHEVNCRLAATEMPPEMTLNYLESGKPDSKFQILYKIVF
jgi:hypothetical protein